ncbi:MAG: TetR family transcriptional regulator [Rhodobiaceae bacterium]|nr:MAG: TetR family transcriptional regulator [Rhodobiaceae bacterium]
MKTRANKTVDLEPKKIPRQKRAIATYERLLDVAARLLEDEGIERISTNMIAERAGITPPALYRYFPNKYAVLRALGDRLMQKQNDVFVISLQHDDQSIEAQMNGAEALLKETLKVTLAQPGALAIMRALRAVPTLQQVRLASHHQVTATWCEALRPLLPNFNEEALWTKARLSVELGYAAIEMAMEEDRPSPEIIMKEAALALNAYWTAALPSSIK